MIAAIERARAGGETLRAVPIASMAAEGDTMVLKTSAPFAPLPAFLTDYATIVLAPSARDATGKVTAWIGTGPYRVTAMDGDRSIDLAAAQRAGTPPAIQRARYLAVPQGETRAAMVEAGDADIAYTLLPAAVPRINAGSWAKVQSIPFARNRQMPLSVGPPQFADVRVRQAISLGIDRAGIAAAIFRQPRRRPGGGHGLPHPAARSGGMKSLAGPLAVSPAAPAWPAGIARRRRAHGPATGRVR